MNSKNSGKTPWVRIHDPELVEWLKTSEGHAQALIMNDDAFQSTGNPLIAVDTVIGALREGCPVPPATAKWLMNALTVLQTEDNNADLNKLLGLRGDKGERSAILASERNTEMATLMWHMAALVKLFDVRAEPASRMVHARFKPHCSADTLLQQFSKGGKKLMWDRVDEAATEEEKAKYLEYYPLGEWPEKLVARYQPRPLNT